MLYWANHHLILGNTWGSISLGNGAMPTLQNLALSTFLPFWIMVSTSAHIKPTLFSVVACQQFLLLLSPSSPKQCSTTYHRGVCRHCQPTIFMKRNICVDEIQPNSCHFQAAFSITVISLAWRRQYLLYWEQSKPSFRVASRRGFTFSH